MGLFTSSRKNSGFEYLDPKAIYLDSACQTLRPEEVIDAQKKYFTEYNSCGGRVKYAWGERLDGMIAETRKLVLDYLEKREMDNVVAFTLNTTYGINLILSSLPPGKYSKVITSDIEHNSVFLPTMTLAERLGIPRIVLSRNDDGSLAYSKEDLSGAIVVVNLMSNIDGRQLLNAKELANDVHAVRGILLIDAAQAFGHAPEILRGLDFDAMLTSAHKAYAPSLGIIVIKKDLLSSLKISWMGGGTVSDVRKDSFDILPLDNEPYARLEAGLQNFSGIAGLNVALKYLAKMDRSPEKNLAKKLYEGLSEVGVSILNTAPGPITTIYSDKVDAHRMAIFLSEANIMARSGHFCCHYYLKEVKGLPPLLRFSLGVYNTEDQINTVIRSVKQIIQNS